MVANDVSVYPDMASRKVAAKAIPPPPDKREVTALPEIDVCSYPAIEEDVAFDPNRVLLRRVFL